METTQMSLLKRKWLTKWRQRIGYGVSDFACNLIWQVISLYLLYFYTDIMNLNAAAISLMFVVTRFVDGVTDLLVGYLIDHTNTRWGKSRPYFLFGAVPFALFAFLCFNVPDFSNSGKLVYAYVTYLGLSFAYTLVNVPMASILPSLTNDIEERTALSTSRKFFAFLGATIVSSSVLTLVAVFGKGNEQLGFKIVMGMFGVISCLLFFFTFSAVRELPVHGTKNPSFKRVFTSLKQNKPWMIFAVNILFMWTSFFIQSSALVYYFSVVIGSKTLSITVATIMSIVPMFANFFVPILAKLLGKRNLYLLSASIQLLGLIVIMFAAKNITLILVGTFISAIGYGVKESIYFSMQADPVDFGVWKTGVNVSGSLSAINGFLGKVAQAISGGVAGALLAWGMYQPGEIRQSGKAIFAIQAMYLYVPMLLIICSIVTMMFYHLDNIYPQIKADLEMKKSLDVK
ncbi:TPA: MFS transporter [Enterococcus faecium]|uniref:MFS transporter n=1 Tax=Enterococcus faecium TaxID=1352 RepID=UPI0005C552B1|nr:MFS transporter [Enterococcus faecium]KNC02086.1 sugar transporter [Enterococcus faecium]MBZ3636135.1 MFS transporter [Enterococcus faecium]MBZ3638544.1 MFS transporter [Enterococcus faecium]MBZ3652021.1 MFS transporter [Enterococcus faecium]MBZ3657639.1 MFS transporter [Enterococcus faecium]